MTSTHWNAVEASAASREEENDEEKSEGVSPSDEQVPLVEPEGHIVASSTETNTLVQVTCPHCSQVMTAQKTGSTLSRLFV